MTYFLEKDELNFDAKDKKYSNLIFDVLFEDDYYLKIMYEDLINYVNKLNFQMNQIE
jgi:hypothetical protein